MNYGILTLVVGFMGLALIINRNTLMLTGRMEQLRTDMTAELGRLRDDLRAETAGLRIELGGQIDTFRTEMNRRFDESGVEVNRRFDLIGHDIADLRERITRLEGSGRAGAPAPGHSMA